MTSSDRILGMYLHLARASQLRRQPLVHDKMLVLAGVVASEMGLEDISAECRGRVLAHNQQHLVGDWPTMDAALADERFQSYVRQLRRRYSPEKAEHLLESLGVEWTNERATYYTDREYATALLAATPESPPIRAARPASETTAVAPAWARKSAWTTLLLIAGLSAAAAWFWWQTHG